MMNRSALALAGLMGLAACGSEPAGQQATAVSKPVAYEPVVQRALAECPAPNVVASGVNSVTLPEGAEEYLEAALSAWSGSDVRTRELTLTDVQRAGPTLVPAFVAVVGQAKQAPERAAAAIAVLGAWADPVAREALCQALETHAVPWVRARCAFELGRLREVSLLPRLLLRLKYEVDGEAVLWLADALAQQGSLAGVEGLLVLAGRTDDAWLSETARAKADELALRHGAPFGGELLRLHANGLIPEPGAQAQECAAWHLIQRLALFDLRQVDDARFVLVRMPDYVVPLLERALRDENRYVRLHAAQCLERRTARNRAAHAGLAQAVLDPSIGGVAAAALGASGLASAGAPLVAALRTTTAHELQVACLSGLERLLVSPPLEAPTAAAARGATVVQRIPQAAWSTELEQLYGLEALCQPRALGSTAQAHLEAQAHVDVPLDVRQAAAQCLLALDAVTRDQGRSVWSFLCDLAVRTDADPDAALRALKGALERRAERDDAEAQAALAQWQALQPRSGVIETLSEANARRATQAAIARAAAPRS